ncbi:MAG TPA: YIP1 family protein [Gemmatimonadales bacterium]|nr:YIP1 family protein [Gemmatimonadales bacterium]
MTAPAPAERPPSVLEDLLEIFYAPRTVFERRRTTPAFGLALVIFVVLMVALTFAFRGLLDPIFQAEFKRAAARAMAANPDLTAEQMAKGRAIAQTFMFVGVGFVSLVTPLLVGVLLWLVGKLVESKAEIGQTMMIATYAMFPRLLQGIANALQALVLPESALKSQWSVSLGVARFFDPDQTSPVLLAALGRVDVFTLWVTALLAIGLSVMGRIPLARAALAAAVVWVLGALPGIVGALRAG